MNRDHLALLVALGAGLALGLGAGSRPTAAQRPGLDLSRYGTRHALPLVGTPADGSAPHTTVRVTNSGWLPTDVVLVEFTQPSTTECGMGARPAGVTRVTCQAGVAPNAETSFDLTGHDSAGLFVYSVNPLRLANACASLEDVRNGSRLLADWERTTWAPGEPLAVTAESATSNAATSFTGEPSLGVTGIARPRQGAGAQALAALAPGALGSRAWIMNVGADCATVPMRLMAAADADCPPATNNQLQLAAYGAARVTVPEGLEPAAALGIGGQSEVVALADRNDADGWSSYGAASSAGGQFGSQIAFPLAVPPMANLTSELWVTNQHVTATAQIAIVMWDGNGTLLKLYNDPVALCAGSTRHYDVRALAGTIPDTTPPRGGGTAGPPMLSLRVESSNLALAEAPPIAGVLTLRGVGGVTAYSGQSISSGVQLFQNDVRRRGGQVRTLVNGVKKNYGQPPVTTLLAVQGLQNGMNENGFLVDIYNERGEQIASEVPGRLGEAGGFMDMSLRRLNLPDGFIGTAVVRGQVGYGIVGALAFDRPTGTDAAPPGDHLSTFAGVVLPHWPDPSQPTPTPQPTRGPTLTPSPTDVPTRPTPQPTATKVSRVEIYLPSLLKRMSPPD